MEGVGGAGRDGSVFDSDDKDLQHTQYQIQIKLAGLDRTINKQPDSVKKVRQKYLAKA